MEIQGAGSWSGEQYVLYEMFDGDGRKIQKFDARYLDSRIEA